MANSLETGPLDALSHTLWRQRRSLDVLVYRLEVQRLVLLAGRTAWFGFAADEVDAALTRVHQDELLRASHVEGVAVQLGLEPEPSLRSIADASDPPWDEIFRDHVAMLSTALAAVDELTSENRELVRAGLAGTRDMVHRLEGTGPSVDYGPAGTEGARGGPSIFDADA